MSIEFQGIAKPFDSTQEDLNTESWVVWRRLMLYDRQKSMEVPDWFFVVACSTNYLAENQAAFAEGERGAVLTQDAFDEHALEDYARKRFSQLSFTDWDDFYAKMSETFIQEDK